MTTPHGASLGAPNHAAVPLRVRKLSEIGSSSAEVLGQLVDASPLLVIIVDDEVRVSWMNAQAERSLGWRLEEVAGRDILASLLPETAEYARALHYVKVAAPQWRDGAIRTRAGRLLEVRWRSERLADGTLAVLIQEERGGGVQLRGSSEGTGGAQPQKLEAIGKFASEIAHDFNNLLTAIRCGTELMLEELEAETSHREDLLDIQEAASRASGLVRQLLAFSRKQVLHPVELNVNSVVSDMEQLLRRLMSEDVEIATSLASNVPDIKADPAQMEQVLMNLAVNARDAMPDGGALVISTERCDVGLQETRDAVVPAGSWVRLTVADTGHGMDLTTREQAFEPFFTTRDDRGGSGLGLSIVYGIVRQSGGLIDIQSELGRGTRIEIYLPAITESDRQATSSNALAPDAASYASDISDAPGPAVRPTLTLLLAEDDAAVRALAARALSGAGYNVVEAGDVREALERWPHVRQKASMLVADMRMPGGGGVRLAESLRRERPDLPVLFMSGYAESAPLKLYGTGQASFIAKPYLGSALVSAVGHMLGARH